MASEQDARGRVTVQATHEGSVQMRRCPDDHPAPEAREQSLRPNSRPKPFVQEQAELSPPARPQSPVQHDLPVQPWQRQGFADARHPAPVASGDAVARACSASWRALPRVRESLPRRATLPLLLAAGRIPAGRYEQPPDHEPNPHGWHVEANESLGRGASPPERVERQRQERKREPGPRTDWLSSRPFTANA